MRLDIRTFADGHEVVANYRPDFDIIFLDIQMKDLDGLEAAAKIRQVDTEVILLFITNSPHYAIRGYAVDALSYLVKPVPYFAFSQELKRGIERVRRANSDALLLPSGGAMHRVSIKEIVYIESIRGRIVVHAIDRTHAFVGTLKSFEAKLADKGFFRSNHCYLVNMDHVIGVEQSICVMVGGARLQVSRPRKRAFLEALTDHVGGRLT